VLRSAFSEDESFIEIDLVNKLQSIVEKQRDQIRTLDTSLADIKSELDEVTAAMPTFQKGIGRPLVCEATDNYFYGSVLLLGGKS
jgi:hypothetical protein